MSYMTVCMLTPDQKVFEGKAGRVTACGLDGYFTILPHHAPMVVALAVGEIEVEDINQKTFYVAVDSGILEISENQVRILSQMAVRAEVQDEALAKMKAVYQTRQKENAKSREQLIKSEMELYRLLRQANGSA